MEDDKPAATESKTADRQSGDVAEKKASSAAESQQEKPQQQGISATAVLWTFGKCVGALLPVYLAGYYRVSTSLLVCGMMVYTGWKHAREAKEARLRSAIQFLGNDEELTSRTVSGIKRELPAWVREAGFCFRRLLQFSFLLLFCLKSKWDSPTVVTQRSFTGHNSQDRRHKVKSLAVTSSGRKRRKGFCSSSHQKLDCLVPQSPLSYTI